MTNYGSGFSRQQLESSASAGDVSVSVSEGKAPDLLPMKHVSSTDDIVHVDGAAGFLPCTMVNTAKVEVPKLFGVSIGLKQCRTKCKVESEGDQMQTRAQTQAETQSSQEPDEHDFIREKVLHNTMGALVVRSEKNIVDSFTNSFSKTSFVRDSG